MRPLVVTNLFPPHAYGGYESLCAGAVEAWRGLGREVAVLTSDLRREDVEPGEITEASVDRALPMYWSDHRLQRPSVRTRLDWERHAQEVIAATLDDFAPDVVSIWNPAALSLGIFDEITRRRLPVVLVVLDVWLDHAAVADAWRDLFASWWARPLRPVAERLAGSPLRIPQLGIPAVACFASEYLRQHAKEHGRWPLDELALVPHGIDPAILPSDPPRLGDRFEGRLLYVGRVAREKGIGTAIRALTQLDGAALDVVGPGEAAHREQLEKLAADLGVDDAVRFVGQLAGDDLLDAYDRADALVFPSTWQEPFGIVPLEAMARGVPVVGTGSGGSGEFLVDGVTALRFSPGDADGLAAAVRRLAADADVRRRLVTNGWEVARWLTREQTYADLDAWHRYVVGELDERPPDRPVLPPALSPGRGQG